MNNKLPTEATMKRYGARLSKIDNKIADLCTLMCELSCECGHTNYKHNGANICMVCPCLKYTLVGEEREKHYEIEGKIRSLLITIFAMETNKKAVAVDPTEVSQ